MSYKVAISAGHYLKTDKGIIKALDVQETREWTLNDRVADKLEAILAKYGDIEVLRLDDTNGIEAVENSERARKANEWGADLYLSIHHNAAGADGKPHSASGICVFVKEDADGETLRIAQAFYDSAIAHTGLVGNRAQAIWRARFTELTVPEMTAVLTENGFMDSKVDVPVILSEEFADSLAEAYAEVIIAESEARRATVEKAQEAEYIAAKDDCKRFLLGLFNCAVDYTLKYFEKKDQKN